MVLVACGGVPKTVPDRPAVTVIDRGAEPRRALRYEPVGTVRVETSSKQVADATITNTTLDQMKQRLEFPTVRRQLAITTAERRANGDLRTVIKVDAVSIALDGDSDPVFRSAYQTDVTREQGLTRTTWMSPTGAIAEVTVEQAPSLVIRELLKLATQDDVVRFPDEQVGIGSSWRVISHPKLQGVQWNSEETIKLTAMTADEVTLESDIVMTGPPQDLVVTPQQTSKLTSGKLHTTKKLTVPLRSLARTVYGESTLEVNVVLWKSGLEIQSSTTVKTVFTEKPVP